MKCLESISNIETGGKKIQSENL